MTEYLDNIPLGLVVRDDDGFEWVYVGYRVTSTRTRSHNFCRLVHAFEMSTVSRIWQYQASCVETLERKFPGLQSRVTTARVSE